jgi:hypothetical protein
MPFPDNLAREIVEKHFKLEEQFLAIILKITVIWDFHKDFEKILQKPISAPNFRDFDFIFSRDHLYRNTKLLSKRCEFFYLRECNIEKTTLT